MPIQLQPIDGCVDVIETLFTAMLVNAVSSGPRRRSVWETSHVSWPSASGGCAANHCGSIIDEPLIVVILSLILVSHLLWSASELRQIDFSDVNEVVTAVPTFVLRPVHKVVDERIVSCLDVVHITWRYDDIEILDAVELDHLLRR